MRECCKCYGKELPLLRINDNKRIRWDLFIIILATYNCVTLPYEAAFLPDYIDEIWNFLLNLTLDLFFLIDIFINFRTTIINERTGEEIKDPKKIAKIYFQGRFILDFIAACPFDIFVSFYTSNQLSNSVRIVKILKLTRIFRLQKIIQYMNSTEDMKLSM